MFKSIIKIAVATILFAGIHTVFASKAAKEKARRLWGERKRNGLYRPLYNGVAIVTLGALAFYAIKLPDRELYKIRGPLAYLMHSIQFFFLLYLLYGTRQIGVLKFVGIPNVISLITGQPFIQLEPEGQGPIHENNKEMKITGPFRFSRHPLNFGMLPIMWLMPSMTTNLAAFNLVTTIYLIFGSFHEEKRLKEAYGQAYLNYQKSGINFFVPSITNLIDSESEQL